MTENVSTQVIEWNVNDAAIEKIAELCKDVDAYRDFDEAKQAKKGLVKMRSTLAEAHKETKAEALAFGKKCDAEKNRLLAKIREIEDPITEQLEAIKNAEEAKEAARIMVIDEEMARIEAHAADRYSLTLDQLRERQENLGEIKITEEVFQEFTERATLLHQDAGMKLDLAIKAEKDRIEQEAIAAEQAEENRRLKEEMEAMRKREQEREAAEAAERAEADRKLREEAEAKEAIEREAREKLEAENRKLREEQERKEQAEREKAEREEAEARAAAQAPDREKLLAYADKVDALHKNKPTLDTDEGNSVLRQAVALLIEVAYDIRTATEEMK